jgi:hypothetical protein
MMYGRDPLTGEKMTRYKYWSAQKLADDRHWLCNGPDGEFKVPLVSKVDIRQTVACAAQNEFSVSASHCPPLVATAT